MSRLDVKSPGRLALRRLWRNKTAMLSACVLLLLYGLAVFAGFFSPYSPTSDESRDFFFHPPMPIRFTDQNGSFHLRPGVWRTYLVNREERLYATAPPVRIFVRYPEANTNPYLPDTIESNGLVLTVTNERGVVCGGASTMQETETNSGIFSAIVSIDPAWIRNSGTLLIRAVNGQSMRVNVVNKRPQPVAPAGSIYMADADGNIVDSYYRHIESYPVLFLVRGWRYRILWLFDSDLHLFGVSKPAHIFLLGTDQSGRDIFSRILHGAQISLTVGLVGVLLTTILGLLVGSIAGYYGGPLDNLLMRFAELLISVPALYLILTLRNIIPDRLQESYDKFAQLGAETFAWQENKWAFAAVLSTISIILIRWCIARPRPARFIAAGIGFVIVSYGHQLLDFALYVAGKILPGSTHLTSDWTYLMIIAILSILGWAGMSRVIRGMVLSLREQEYVQAAKATGASDLRIITRHILPNTIGYVIVRATLLVPAYILGEVALSFLGVGVQEPTASWGNMLSAAQSVRVLHQFTWSLAPGFFIFLTVLAYNFLGDGLRDALDPRQK